MPKQRSPNCPQITFEEAADKGRLVYEREHTHPAAREVIAESLGYSGINGRSLSMLGALRQYGILEGNGDALKISDDAVAYYELQDSAERTAALSRMVFNPPFFAQIHVDFGDSLPSESNLKHYLIKAGFLPSAAAAVIRVYRENIRLVGDSSKRYTDTQEHGGQQMSSTSVAITAYKPHNEQVTSLHQASIPQPTWAQSFTLSKGAKAELMITGDVTKEGLARLKTYIDLTIAALEEETNIRDNEPDPQVGLV